MWELMAPLFTDFPESSATPVIAQLTIRPPRVLAQIRLMLGLLGQNGCRTKSLRRSLHQKVGMLNSKNWSHCTAWHVLRRLSWKLDKKAR